MHVPDVRLREECGHSQFNFRRRREGLVQRRLATRLERRNRLLEHVQVHGEPDLGHLATLLLAEQLAGAADLQVVRGQHETRAQLFHRLDRFEPLGRIPRERLAGGSDQISVGAVVRAADAPAQLVQLRQAHVVGPVDDEGVRRGHVDTALDDRGAHQQVEAPVVEIHHELLQLALAHLAMAHPNARFGNEGLNFRGHLVDRADFVVHEVDLAAAAQLAQSGFTQCRFVPLDHESLDREALSRRRGDQRQIPQPAHCHVERAGDRSCRQRQYVYVGPQSLQALLVAHAEAMLLVNDEQSQVLEARMRVKQAVRCNDDIDLSVLDTVDRLLSLLCVAEARKGCDAYRPLGESVAEICQVLLREQRRGRQHGDLFARLRCHEGRAHGHFGLAETHVAANDAVHRTVARHVLENLADRLGLVFRLLEREGFAEGAIVGVAHRQLQALLRLAAGIEVQQLRGDVPDLFRGAFARFRPLVGAQLVQRRALGRTAGVATHQVQGVHRYIHAIAVHVFEDQEFPRLARDLHDLQTDVAPDAILLVDDRGSGVEILQALEDGLRIGGRAFPASLLPGARAKQLRLGDDGDVRLSESQPLQVGRNGQRQSRLPTGEVVPSSYGRGGVSVRPQHLLQHLAPSRRIRCDQHTALKLAQKRIQRRERSLRPRIDTQLARRGRGKVPNRSVGCRQLRVGLERIQLDARKSLQLCIQLLRLEE